MVLVAVVCSVVGMSPCLYFVVHAAAPTACACMDIPHGLASRVFLHVSHGVVCLFFFRVALSASVVFSPCQSRKTLLVPWLPRPMCAGDSSGCPLLLVVVWQLCPFPRALTSAPLRRVAAWRIV